MTLTASQGSQQVHAFGLKEARPLPDQITSRVSICITSKLFSHATHLLTQCLTSGVDTPRALPVPSPNLLALLATITVHPWMTTQTRDEDNHRAADEALQYLRLLQQLVAPQQSGLSSAFHFTSLSRSRTGRKSRDASRTRVADIDQPDSKYAREQSLWQHATNFWSIVGWAFNCSVLHEHRWARWKLFLTLLLNHLEADLASTIDLATKSQPGEDDEDDSTAEKTLLCRYLADASGGRSEKRRIMRAILADGSQKSLAEFGEIWPNETLLPRVKPERSRADYKLDLDDDKYGDYNDTSDEEVVDPANLETHGEQDTLKRSPADLLGDLDAIKLRQRLLALLMQFCHYFPREFLDLEELLDLYGESFRGLPLTPFQQLLLPAKSFLDADMKSSLDQILLRSLLDSNAPVYNRNELTQEDFETHYAPFAANLHSVQDNAKTSLLIEDMFRMLWKAGALERSEVLRSAVVKGVEARNEKARSDARKKTPEQIREEEVCRSELKLSGQRMLLLLDMIQ